MQLDAGSWSGGIATPRSVVLCKLQSRSRVVDANFTTVSDCPVLCYCSPTLFSQHHCSFLFLDTLIISSVTRIRCKRCGSLLLFSLCWYLCYYSAVVDLGSFFGRSPFTMSRSLMKEKIRKKAQKTRRWLIAGLHGVTCRSNGDHVCTRRCLRLLGG